MASASAAAAGQLPERWSTLADTVFSHYTGESNMVSLSLAQDGQGFLWVSTSSGLTRWDGYSQRRYVAELADKASLPDNSVQALHTDRQGRLWVGTNAGGLVRYAPEVDGFIRHPAPPGAGQAARTVWAIGADGADGLWLGTGAGLGHLDFSTGAQRTVPIRPGTGTDPPVKAVLQDSDGALWVGSMHGLWHRAPGSAQFEQVPLGHAGHGQVVVTTLVRDSGGRLWVGTRPEGAFVIEPGTMEARPVVGSGAPLLHGASVMAIAEVAPGEVWVGTYGGGVVVVEPGAGWRMRRLQHHVALPTTLRDDDIGALLRDRNGLVWVATTLALSVHDPRPRGVATLFGSATGGRAITTGQVPFVLPMPDGRVWLSAGDGGIDIIDPLAGRVGALRPNAARPLHALPPGRVLAMATAPGGDVFLGTREGLYRTDERGRHLRRLAVPQRPANAMVWSLAFDAGVLWMGGIDGLWALDVSGSGTPRLLRHLDGPEISGARITALLRGRDDTLWVGTGAGLARLDIATGTLTQIPAEADDPQGLLGGYTASMLLDRSGRLWLSSVGSGIHVLERHDAAGRPRFRRIGLRDGLPHMGVNKLLLAPDGQVWASTDDGLAVIDPATFAVRALGAAQGVAIPAYWSNAGGVTQAGELLFGGLGGLTVVRPAVVPASSAPPPVVVTEARASGQPLVASQLNGPAPPRLTVSADDRSLMVEFAALDFAAAGSHVYSYRLQGLETGWTTTAASRRLASYTNLPPGDYTLQLRGSRSGQHAQAQMLALPVTVLPAWHQTIAFRLGCGAVLLLFVWALVQLRTAVLQRRQRELSVLVAERTAELQQRSDELRESRAQLEKIAYFDPLTGLANRRRFNDELRQHMADALRGGPAVTLLLIDLDRFKQINDSLGHDAGDALLVEVAQRLRSNLQAGDGLARLGGDEFAVLLTGRSGPEAAAMLGAACARLVSVLGQPVAFGSVQLHPSASIGAASCPHHADAADTLYKCADLALYDAKRAGRGTWRWYTPAPAPPALPQRAGVKA